MAWTIKDEWIDLARARHVVIFSNTDTGAVHHLNHEFNVPSCAHCGQLKGAIQPEDFHAAKYSTLKQLNDHHQTVMAYKEKHPHVRIGSGPKA